MRGLTNEHCVQKNYAIYNYVIYTGIGKVRSQVIYINLFCVFISDVPPLEDMSELIKQVDALRELKQKQNASPAQVFITFNTTLMAQHLVWFILFPLYDCLVLRHLYICTSIAELKFVA